MVAVDPKATSRLSIDTSPKPITPPEDVSDERPSEWPTKVWAPVIDVTLDQLVEDRYRYRPVFRRHDESQIKPPLHFAFDPLQDSSCFP